MRIRIQKINLHNFMSFGEASVDFETPGYTLVQGVNNNPADLATSNGSGKSSIFEAIIWALTGETIRGSKDICNLHADNGAYVELLFEVDGVKYKVIRTKEYKPLGTTLKIYVNDEDKSGKGIRDTEKILTEYLPDLTSSLIGSVIILGQGLPQRFSNNSPSGRKDVLEKLSKSDFMIQDLKDRVASRKQELSSKVRAIEDNILKLETKKDLFEKEKLDKTIKLNTLNEQSIDGLLAKKGELETSVANAQTSINEINLSLGNMAAMIESSTNMVLTLHNKEDEEVNSVSEQYQPKINALSSKKNEVNGVYVNALNELNNMKSIKDICPTCGQKLPGVFKPDTSEVENMVDTSKRELLNIENQLRVVMDEYQSKVYEIKNSYKTSAQELKDKIASIEVDRKALTKNKSEVEKLISDYSQEIFSIDSKVNTYNDSKNNLQDRINELTKSIESIANDILYSNNDREEMQKHVDVVSKMSTVITRDFRGYLLTSVIDFINKKAKEYSLEVFETDKIDFTLDGNNIAINYDSKDYSNLSGGERQKVDLIVQFAIRDMLCKYLNFSSNILAVDELFDNLDSTGCEKILNLISNKLSDVESIYIITHHADIPVPADNILTVVKGDNGISHIS